MIFTLEIATILFIIQSSNIWIFHLWTDAPSSKSSRNLLSSQAQARCDHTGTKLNIPYHLYDKVSQNKIEWIHIFQKQNHYNKIFFTSKICKSAAMGRSRRLVYEIRMHPMSKRFSSSEFNDFAPLPSDDVDWKLYMNLCFFCKSRKKVPFGLKWQTIIWHQYSIIFIDI